MGKLSFLAGAGIGYVLGARAGRARYEKIKGATAKLWENPKIQQNVHKVEAKVTDAAKSSGSQLTDKVASTVKGRLSGSRGAHHPDFPVGNTGRGTDGPMPPTTPQPPL